MQSVLFGNLIIYSRRIDSWQATLLFAPLGRLTQNKRLETPVIAYL
jgi:hypothetical protein